MIPRSAKMPALRGLALQLRAGTAKFEAKELG